MGDKKPKLVGLTSCGAGAGVTTLAGGLAAALSKTGNGNVLLVTMNPEKGVAHSFYNGKPGCGLAQVLEPSRRGEAQVQDNLYVASLEVEKRENASKVSRNGVTSLMPKIQGSDYDYIIFDMPPVTQVTAKAQRVLKFKPPDFGTGLKETYRWYMRHTNFPKQDYTFEDTLLATAPVMVPAKV